MHYIILIIFLFVNTISFATVDRRNERDAKLKGQKDAFLGLVIRPNQSSFYNKGYNNVLELKQELEEMDKNINTYSNFCEMEFNDGKKSALGSFYEDPNAGESECYDDGFTYGKILRDLGIKNHNSSYSCNLKFNDGYNDAKKNDTEGKADYCYQLGHHIGGYEIEMVNTKK
jgi:hypothetical protein